MLNVIHADYIRTARAKGLPERLVIFKHALRNALLPVITVIGGNLTWLLGGTIIIEQIFGFPGMGNLLIEALTGRDFNMIQSIVGIYV